MFDLLRGIFRPFGTARNRTAKTLFGCARLTIAAAQRAGGFKAISTIGAEGKPVFINGFVHPDVLRKRAYVIVQICNQLSFGEDLVKAFSAEDFYGIICHFLNVRDTTLTLGRVNSISVPHSHTFTFAPSKEAILTFSGASKSFFACMSPARICASIRA